MALEIPFGPDQTMVGRQCRRRRGRQLGTRPSTIVEWVESDNTSFISTAVDNT